MNKDTLIREAIPHQKAGAFERAGLHTLGDLANLTEAEVLSHKGIGRNRLNNARSALEMAGFSFRQATGTE